MLFNGVFALLTLFIPSLLYKEVLLTSAILGVFAVAFFVYYRSPVLVPIFIFSMLFGGLAEIFSVSRGAWTYAFPTFFGVPLWLFFVWGNAGLFLYRTGVEFERLGFHK